MTQNPFKLRVYQDAYKLSLEVFSLIKDIRHFRLRDQLFGAVTSIGANIAEMGAFENKNQIRQKLIVCVGECNEAEYWLNFSKDSEIIEPEDHKKHVNEIKKIRMMLFSLLKSLQSSS